MQAAQPEPEVVMSYRIARGLASVADTSDLREVRCVRFSGSRFTSWVASFSSEGRDALEEALKEPSTANAYEAALKAAFGTDQTTIRHIARNLASSIEEAAKALAPPFHDGVPRAAIDASMVAEVEVGTDQSGTHFHVRLSLVDGSVAEMLFGASILSIFLADLE